MELKYFVLKPRGKSRSDGYATASRVAMRAYAKTIEDINRELALDLRTWAAIETKNQSGLPREESEEGHDGSSPGEPT